MGIWILPAVGYIIGVGVLGIVSKYALRDVTWPTLILYTTSFYVVVSVVLLVTGQAHYSFDRGGLFSAATGVLAVASLICLYIALQLAPASKVVPFTSIYPALTVLLAVLILHEHVTAFQMVGVGLILAGAILVNV